MQDLVTANPQGTFMQLEKGVPSRRCAPLPGSQLGKFTQPLYKLEKVTFPARCSPRNTWLIDKEKDSSSDWITVLNTVFCYQVHSSFSCVLFWLSRKIWDLILIWFWHHHRTLCEMMQVEVWGIFQLDNAYPETLLQLGLPGQHLIPLYGGLCPEQVSGIKQMGAFNKSTQAVVWLEVFLSPFCPHGCSSSMCLHRRSPNTVIS